MRLERGVGEKSAAVLLSADFSQLIEYAGVINYLLTLDMHHLKAEKTLAEESGCETLRIVGNNLFEEYFIPRKNYLRLLNERIMEISGGA